MTQAKSQTKNWRRVELGTLCAISTGKKDVNEGGDGGKYHFFTCARETLKSNNYSFDTDAILVVGNGSYTGFTKRYSGKFDLYQRTYALHDFDKSVDFKFLYYYLKEKFESKYMGGSHGTAIPYITKPIISDFEILLPPIPTQKQIADVLSTYDDLIENNTRRIQILEQMAQEIYKEWFVNFRFPGHEKVKMIDSGTDFGKIPEGWKISNIRSILDIKSGYSFKSQNYNQTGLFKIVTIKNIHDGKFTDDFNHISDIPEMMPDYCKLVDGDILLSLTGNVGRVCVVYGKNLLLNQRVGKLVPSNIKHRSFIYSLFRSDEFKKKLELLSNGVAQQNLSPIQTLNLEIILPIPTLIAEYESIVGELINLSISLNKQNKNLRQTRDLLLPKLVTGEIRI